MAPLLEVEHLSKTFGGQRALDDVDFGIARPGEIHALIGQNGSGKSTLIKVLAGYHKPDRGASAQIEGEPFELGDATSAFAAGLRFVQQDLGLVPDLDAVNNLALGRGYRKNRLGLISWRREENAGRVLLNRLGYDFDMRLPVGRLNAAERTGVAIARAVEDLEGGTKVLVLDEPTASLPAAEVDRLFEVIRAVQEEGVAIVYVSHRFSEVFRIADRITVLRDGRHVATEDASSLDEAALVRLTIGRELTAFEAAEAMGHEVTGRTEGSGLRVRDLAGKVVAGLDFEVGPGEIIGISGVTGSGREEVAELIYGGAPREGHVEVDGEEVPAGRPDASVAHGMALVPAERLSKAAFRDMTLRENVTIAGLGSFAGVLSLRRRAERDDAQRWLDQLEVVPPDPEARLATLSGGNQQKVIIARALRLTPRIIVLDEPTQGVDVGAKAAIHAIVKEAASEGAAVLVVSSESEELLAVCDRVLVLVEGRVIGDLAADDLTVNELTDLTLREHIVMNKGEMN
jgi:ribose transport system ATP-binding protein